MGVNLLYSQIISDVEEKIKSGVLETGQKLPSEREMSAQYEVSRAVVREAIKVLNEKGLVEVKVGKGIYVTKPTKSNVTRALQRVIRSSDSTLEDMIEVREELELSAIRKVIANSDSTGMEKLRSACSLMDKEGIKVSEFVDKDAQFHLTLAKLTDNNIFYLLISSFYDLIDKALFDLSHMVPSDNEEAQVQHWTIVNALEQKDIKLSERTMRAHMDMIRDEVKMLRERHLI